MLAAKPGVFARIRQRPTINAPIIGQMNPGAEFKLIRYVPGTDEPLPQWAYGTASTSDGGILGYVRSDLLQESTPQQTAARFAPPIPEYFITTQYGQNGHKGIDLAAPLGTSIRAAALGRVVLHYVCARCSDAKPNFAAHGLPLGDAAALADPGWGYGFGNAVAVRYGWSVLPDAAAAALAARDLRDGFVDVIYAHMRRIYAVAGECVNEKSILGEVGNTGNSSGSHLHVEVRLSPQGDERDIFLRQVLDPNLLFVL